MIDNVLYIIGNGFDIHHCVKSSYCYFRDWLGKNNNDLFSLYETVCEYDALWSEFEKGMAYVSRDYLIENGLMLLPERGWDPDEDQYADLFMATDYARESASNLIEGLKTEFHRWIQRIRAPREYRDKMLMVDDHARFLSFNYTNFLETQYGIPRQQIKYIHGNKLGSIGSLIVGHGEDDYKIFKEWEKSKGYYIPRRNKKGKKFYFRDEAWKVYHSDLPEYEMIAESVEGYYSEAHKPVDQLIKANRQYFDDLYDVKTIFVWGFSFGDVDMPYLKEIIAVNDEPETIKWNISYYKEEEKEKFRARLMSLGVDCDQQASFKPLSFWQISSF
ncbi:MAG: bacteriophage abortive infection AbiH family protein [Oscillospiraceae bacterium]|nr:bacteriophage abortive infection AbiH family protein [Oscillospiraceae bacterium]